MFPTFVWITGTQCICGSIIVVVYPIVRIISWFLEELSFSLWPTISPPLRSDTHTDTHIAGHHPAKTMWFQPSLLLLFETLSARPNIQRWFPDVGLQGTQANCPEC